MYALSKSILEFVGQYRVELYSMEFLNHDATVLQISGMTSMNNQK